MAPRWLLLAHQLPTRPSHGRVKTWRRLQQIGAVPARNSVYVLPNTPQCREDFAWLRSEIVAAGGEATVFAADAMDADGDQAIEIAFRRNRDADYAAFRREVAALLAPRRERRGATPVKNARESRETFSKAVRALRERLAAINQIDFCLAPGRQAAGEALASLEQRLAESTRMPTITKTAVQSTTDFRNRRWVTRPRPGVDRMASAWLIRRFIDPQATFAFGDEPAAGDVPFDMYRGDFSHRGSLCTFEVLASCFGLDGESVTRIACIVHDLDMKEARYAPPEAPAVGRLIEGLRQMHADDQVLLEQGIGVFQALALSFEASSTARPTRQSADRRRSATARVRRPGKGAKIRRSGTSRR